jgi:hypothetical protein
MSLIKKSAGLKNRLLFTVRTVLLTQICGISCEHNAQFYCVKADDKYSNHWDLKGESS